MQDPHNSDPAVPPAPPAATPAPAANGVPHTDDQPTIISGIRQRSHLADSALAGNLQGRRLGQFELIEPVGVGGMAAVIRAHDTQLGRTVALKILPPDMAADPENITRFKSEARAAAKLDHENVARVYFCGEDQGLHFIAFEFVEGVNLRVLIDRRGVLPAGEALHYLIQVATGLAHAAARGVVHRDVKPSNIIVTPEGRAKVVDMGLARHLGPLGEQGGVTQSGVTLGTFDYISPEQALEPRLADCRSDIYSLGCTFYHALTGQPPVPEGTAAKKLHHHQQVAPVDPRQLNPEVPDELAAVLGRMMAKDPKDRYQQPEQLVQHLHSLAERLNLPGAPAVGPGGLYVDAPLPAPPRVSPWLVGGLAVAGVAVLAVLAGLNGDPGGPRADRPPPWAPDARPAPAPPAAAGQPPAPPPAAEPPAVAEAKTAAELVTLLRSQRPPSQVRLTDTEHPYDLAELAGPDEPGGLVVTNRDLVLTGDARHPPTVRLGPGAGRPGLTVAGRDDAPVRLRLAGLRFVLSAAGGGGAPTLILGQGLERCEVEDCVFVQENAPEGATALDLQLAPPATTDSGAEPPPNVVLQRCLFVRGGRAVRAAGAARVRAVGCAFGPHAELFDLAGGGPKAGLDLDGCSALLDRGTVFHLRDAYAGQVRAGHCVFGRDLAEADPGRGEDLAGELVLVRRTGRAGDARFDNLPDAAGSPQRNAYFGLSAVVIDDTGTDPPRAATWMEAPAAFRDPGAEVLTARPWQADRPLEELDRAPAAAFCLRLDLPALRVAGGDVPGRQALVGVASLVGRGALYGLPLSPLPTADEAPMAARRTWVVDPGGGGPGETVYSTLAAAAADAGPGDVILVRHTGELAVEPVALKRADAQLTVRPASGCRPVLTLGATTDRTAALFRVAHGSLVLEDLQFRLRPDRPQDFVRQAVVELAGQGQCQFRNCVVTLQEQGKVELSAVALSDTEPAAGGDRKPQVSFRNCLVRGKGDLVDVLAGRRFTLSADGLLAALDGSLVSVEGPRSPGGPPAAQVSLKHVTAYLTEHLLAVRGGDERKTGPLVAVHLDCQQNLFVAAAARPLVRLEGVDEAQLKSVFGWDGKDTLYGNYTQLLDLPAAEGQQMAMPPLNHDRWLDLTHEEDRPFVRVRFDGVPAGSTDFSRVKPDDFRPRYDRTDLPAGVGAPLGSLPQPAEEGMAMPPERGSPEE
jgi:hypothetical protein